jgi:hypothetical protein
LVAQVDSEHLGLRKLFKIAHLRSFLQHTLGHSTNCECVGLGLVYTEGVRQNR